MTQASARTETKSAASKAFAHYLRTGRRLPDSAFESNTLKIGLKFNQNHDPSNGQFTFGPGGSASLARGKAGNSRAAGAAPGNSGPAKPRDSSQSRNPVIGTGSVRMRLVVAKPGHQPIQSRVEIDERSAKYEVTARTDPGRIVRTVGDRGGPSYGTYQLSSNKGTLGEFIKSPEARKYVGELKGLRETSAEFDKKWKEIAVREPDTFQKAQADFVTRTHYDRPVARILEETGYDVNRAGDSIPKTVYSTNVQHGPSGGRRIIVKAIKAADARFMRSDPRHDAAVINNIYDERSRIFARTKRRYVQERLDALLELTREGRQ